MNIFVEREKLLVRYASAVLEKEGIEKALLGVNLLIDALPKAPPPPPPAAPPAEEKTDAQPAPAPTPAVGTPDADGPAPAPTGRRKRVVAGR